MLHLLSRVFAALVVLLVTICLAELTLAGVRLLSAERAGRETQVPVPDDFWSVLREMEEQARAMGLR